MTKRMLILFFLALSLAVNADTTNNSTIIGNHTSIVSGTLADCFGVLYSPRLRFIPRSTPLPNGALTILDVPRYVNVTNGAFSVNLQPGAYDVDPGPPNQSVRIIVPVVCDSYTFNYCAALATNALPFSSPVFYTKAQIDALLANVGGSPNAVTNGQRLLVLGEPGQPEGFNGWSGAIGFYDAANGTTNWILCGDGSLAMDADLAVRSLALYDGTHLGTIFLDANGLVAIRPGISPLFVSKINAAQLQPTNTANVFYGSFIGDGSGLTGLSIFNGTNGVNGRDGTNGVDGAQGIQGVAGRDGTNATLAQWNAAQWNATNAASRPHGRWTRARAAPRSRTFVLDWFDRPRTSLDRPPAPAWLARRLLVRRSRCTDSRRTKFVLN